MMNVSGKEKVLMLTTDDALHLIEEGGAYYDNGGMSDGNAWLPIDPIEFDEQDEVIKQGMGRLVDVVYHDLNDIDYALQSRGYLSVAHFALMNGVIEVEDEMNEGEIEDAVAAILGKEYYDLVKEALDATGKQWAGFMNGDVIVVEW